MRPLLVISGGQTGADRGGLDGAIRAGVPHGGWCPRGRRSEDGAVPSHYNLTECDSSDYKVRTELNVRDSDWTVVFTDGPVTPGSRLTFDIASRLQKPATHFDISRILQSRFVSDFALAHGFRTINVAGSRESKCPGLQAFVASVMFLALRTIVERSGLV